MSGSKNSSSIDAAIADLFETLIARPEGPMLDSRMALHPAPEKKSYFIPAPRPRMTRVQMEEISRNGLFAEVSTLFADIPEPNRGKIVEKMRKISEALAEEPSDESGSELSTLIYAMH